MAIEQYNINPELKSAVSQKEQTLVASQILVKPIDQVEKIFQNTVDTFIPEAKDDETKKSHKTAIRVVSIVAVLSALIALLSPKVSSGLLIKMRTFAEKMGDKAKDSENLRKKIYSFAEIATKKGTNLLEFGNNFNSIKDQAFKWICEKNRFLKKTHQYITRCFDKLSKKTIFRKYSAANSRMNSFNSKLNSFIPRLSDEEKNRLAVIMDKIKISQEYMSKEKIAERLASQETIMSDLEPKTIQQIKDYGKGVWHLNGKYLKENMKFWAQNILIKKRGIVQAEGTKYVESLVGSTNGQKGLYNEALEIIIPHLNENEKTIINELFSGLTKRIKKANISECEKYFDKKRDYMLGSAPTDVLTAIFGLTSCGLAIGVADDKYSRMSRAVTLGFPAIVGLGVSMGMGSLLYSGVKGGAIGAASSGILSLTGSAIDKYLIPKQNKEPEKEVSDV